MQIHEQAPQRNLLLFLGDSTTMEESKHGTAQPMHQNSPKSVIGAVLRGSDNNKAQRLHDAREQARGSSSLLTTSHHDYSQPLNDDEQCTPSVGQPTSE